MTSNGDVSGRTRRSEKEPSYRANLFCCVCRQKRIQRQAVKYCVTCEDNYCEHCSEFHSLIPTMSGHVVVDRSNFMGRDGSSNLPPNPTERCAKHLAKIVNMFCKTHQQVGCATCMTTKHDDSCVKLYIPENIDYLFDIDKIKQTEQQLGSAIEKLEAALSLRDKCAEDLLRAVDEAERQLEMYTEIFTTAVTELKYKTRASLDSISKSLKTVFSEQKSVISEEVVCAKDILGKTKNANLESNNKSEQFACSALAAMARESCDGVNQRLFCPNVKEIVFKPNVATEELLKSLLLHSSFGEFSIVHTPQQINVWPYKVMCIDKLRIKARRHEDNTGIGGSCALQDGTVLLADRNNKCLKRLPPCGTSVSDCLQLPGSPRSITVINQTQVAVTLPYQTQVQVITLDKTMTKTRTFKTDFECRFIAHDNNELFLSDGIRMCVYTVAGKFLRQLFRKHMAETLSSGIRNMAMSSNGCVLFVADWEDGLIAIDRTSGRQLWCYTGEDLQGAWGVCVDGQGSLFISGNRSHNVLQFSESGEKIGDLLTESDGLLKPWSISFAANTRTLVVTRGYPNGNSVDIFRLAPVVEL